MGVKTGSIISGPVERQGLVAGGCGRADPALAKVLGKQEAE